MGPRNDHRISDTCRSEWLAMVLGGTRPPCRRSAAYHQAAGANRWDTRWAGPNAQYRAEDIGSRRDRIRRNARRWSRRQAPPGLRCIRQLTRCRIRIRPRSLLTPPRSSGADPQLASEARLLRRFSRNGVDPEFRAIALHQHGHGILFHAQPQKAVSGLQQTRT